MVKTMLVYVELYGSPSTNRTCSISLLPSLNSQRVESDREIYIHIYILILLQLDENGFENISKWVFILQSLRAH